LIYLSDFHKDVKEGIPRLPTARRYCGVEGRKEVVRKEVPALAEIHRFARDVARSFVAGPAIQMLAYYQKVSLDKEEGGSTTDEWC